MDGGDPMVLGHIEGQPFHDGYVLHAGHDPVDSTIAHVVDGEVYVRELASLGSVVAPVGRQDGWHPPAFLNPRQKIVGSALKATGEVRLWNVDDRSPGLIRSLKYKPMSQAFPGFDPSGRFLAAGDTEGTMWFWDLQAPPDAEPIVLRRTGQQQLLGLAFHPQSPWLVTGDNASATLWPLDRYALELRGHAAPITSLAFDPEGRWLASLTGLNGEMRMWPLEGTDSVSVSVVDAGGRSLAVAPDGAHLLIAADGTDRGVGLLNADASDGRLLGGRENWEATFSPDGRFAAATGGQWQPEVAVVTVWDLDTGETIVLDVGDGQFVVDAVFLSPQRLVSSGLSGLRLWDLASRSFETLSEIPGAYLAATADGKTLLRIVGPGAQAAQGGEVWVYDLASGETRALTSHGDGVVDVAVHPDGKMVVTGGVDGTVRVGPLSGEEPHLLLGHEGLVQAVGIDPKGRWIAAGGVDGVIRLWPVPEGRPFHTLPREELLARLRSATNYRVVADEGSPDGYRLEIGPFPGWESLPTW
jgi:WD40 repeat protein